MAEILSPGVFIEEVPSAVQVVQPVSTSNMGIIGATQRGPTDEATLVTSFSQFTRIFGDLIADSRTGLSMAAYFSNGGRRAYVVRVMPGDAVEADGDITSARRDFSCFVGDGIKVIVTDTDPVGAVLADFPVVGIPATAGVTFRWRADDAPVVTEPLFQRDGTSPLVQDTVGHPDDAVPSSHYEGRAVTSMPSDGVDSGLPSIIPGGTITLNWLDQASGAQTINLTQVGTTLRAAGTGGAAVSTAEIDLVTGFITITFIGADRPILGDDGTPITLD